MAGTVGCGGRLNVWRLTHAQLAQLTSAGARLIRADARRRRSDNILTLEPLIGELQYVRPL